MISRKRRERQAQHKSCVVWLSGLSGSGKSTLSKLLEQKLFDEGHRTYILDGDQIRERLSQDLGFSKKDRTENLRRAAELAYILADAGIIVIAAFITPLEKDRELVRNILRNQDLLEVFVKCPLAICEERDVKGLYAKARKGLVTNFTGIDSAFEEPAEPRITVNTHIEREHECMATIYELLLPYLKPAFIKSSGNTL